MKRRAVHIGLIVSVASLVYINTLHNGFHLDDFYRVVDNPGIEKLAPIGRHFVDPGTMSTLERITQYRPLLPLTLSLNYSLAGNSLVSYHLGNLFFQIVASILVYLLCLELFRHRPALHPDGNTQNLALFVSILFAIHPVSGILVNYICSRDLILMQLFLIGSFLAYLRMRRLGASPIRWAIVLLLLALSMLSKPNAVVAPVLVFLFELTVGKERMSSARPWLRALPFAAVILVYFLFTKLYLGSAGLAVVVSEGSASVWEYPLTQAKLHLFHYFRNFFWPFMIRQAPWVEPANSILDYKVISGLAFIIISLVVAGRFRKAFPLMSFCILAYWTLMIPTSFILPFHHLAVDYRPYPSSLFLFLLIGLMGYKLWKPSLTTPIFLGLIAYFAFSSISMNKTWRTEETLWSHSVAYGGDALAHLNLAMSISDRSDPRVQKHLQEALRINPNYIVANINLGLLLIDQGQTEEGIEYCRKAVALNPRRGQSHYWLSHAYSKLGMIQEAAEASARSAQLDRRNLKYQYKAALDAQRTGDYSASLQYLRVIEQSQPDHEETLFLKGFALQMTGELSGAIESYRAFLAQHANHSQAQFNVGHALMTLGKYGEAIQHFERTLYLKPDYAEVHLHLATCSEKLGNREEANRQRELYQKRHK